MSSILRKNFSLSKLILLAPYYGLPHFNNVATSLGNPLSYILPRLPKFQSGRIQSREGRKRYQCPVYTVDVKSFLGLQHLIKQAQIYIQKIPSGTSILWCHGPDDPVAGFQIAQSVIHHLHNLSHCQKPITSFFMTMMLISSYQISNVF